MMPPEKIEDMQTICCQHISPKQLLAQSQISVDSKDPTNSVGSCLMGVVILRPQRTRWGTRTLLMIFLLGLPRPRSWTGPANCQRKELLIDKLTCWPGLVDSCNKQDLNAPNASMAYGIHMQDHARISPYLRHSWKRTMSSQDHVPLECRVHWSPNTKPQYLSLKHAWSLNKQQGKTPSTFLLHLVVLLCVSLFAPFSTM